MPARDARGGARSFSVAQGTVGRRRRPPSSCRLGLLPLCSRCSGGGVLPPAGMPKLRRTMGGSVRRGVAGDAACCDGRLRAPRCGDGGVAENGVTFSVRGVESAGAREKGQCVV